MYPLDRTYNNYRYEQDSSAELNLMLDSSKDTLDRWESLIKRGALVNRISIITNNVVNYFDSLPHDIHVLLMGYFDAKDLGRIALVCTKFNTIANSPAVWQALCEKEPDVDMTQLVANSNNYKILYREV